MLEQRRLAGAAGAREDDGRKRLRGGAKPEVTVVNPTLLVEVFSDATEEYDRGEKLEHYRQIPSLRECVLVSHRARRIESWRREDDDTWSHREAGPAESLRLDSVGCELRVDDVYRGGLEVS